MSVVREELSTAAASADVAKVAAGVVTVDISLQLPLWHFPFEQLLPLARGVPAIQMEFTHMLGL